MAKYEIRDVVGDYGIFEDGECKLILNSRTNAEYIKAILEHEARHPNAAVPYRPETDETERYISANGLKRFRDEVISGKLHVSNEGDLIDLCPTADVVSRSHLVSVVLIERREVAKRLFDVIRQRLGEQIEFLSDLEKKFL